MSEVIRTQTEITAYNEFRSQLAELKKHNAALAFDYEDEKGNRDARSHVYQLRRTKAAVEEVRKAEKKEALEYGRRVDDEAREIKDELESMIEVHAAPLAEIEQREKDRIAALEGELTNIRDQGARAERDWQSLDVDRAEAYLNYLTDLEVTAERWQEFCDTAVLIIEKAGAQIEEALQKRHVYDAEQAELKKLREQAAAQERKDRDEQIAHEATKKAEREAERRAKAEHEAAEQRVREANDRAEKAEREAKLAEAQAAVVAARRAKESQETAEREQQEKLRDRKLRTMAVDQIAAHLHKNGVSATAARTCAVLLVAGKIPRVQVQL